MKSPRDSFGFTTVELLLSAVIFPLIVVGLSNAFDAVSKQYTTARKLNEVYAVLSACPEVDRALDYNSLASTTNCYPNNSFTAEGPGGGTITYTPTITVSDTSALSSGDALKNIYDSKTVDVSVSIPNSPAAPYVLRLLITRNGLGQL